MAMLAQDKNLTQENISIGTFDHKVKFTYAILQFKVPEGERAMPIHNQGAILDRYIQDNYLLIARNSLCCDDNETWYSTSLFISWDESPEKVVSSLNRFYYEENGNCFIQGNIVYNNGKDVVKGYNCVRGDSAGAYSYLISHRYEEGKYIYTITSGTSFKNTLMTLSPRFKKNTVLDLVFTGRVSNNYNNTYNFDNYKIKEWHVGTNGVVLSNKEGLVNLETCECQNVLFLNFLPDWKNQIYVPNYYSGMDVRMYDFVPEKNVKIEKGKLFYNGENMQTSTHMRAILADDLEERQKLIDILICWGFNPSLDLYIKNHYTVTKEEVLEEFCKKVADSKKKEEREEYTELKYSIAQIERELKDIDEKIAVLEYRTKEFIPMPEIKLPQNMPKQFFSAYSLLRLENNKYIIEEEGE